MKFKYSNRIFYDFPLFIDFELILILLYDFILEKHDDLANFDFGHPNNITKICIHKVCLLLLSLSCIDLMTDVPKIFVQLIACSGIGKMKGNERYLYSHFSAENFTNFSSEQISQGVLKVKQR